MIRPTSFTAALGLAMGQRGPLGKTPGLGDEQGGEVEERGLDELGMEVFDGLGRVERHRRRVVEAEMGWSLSRRVSSGIGSGVKKPWYGGQETPAKHWTTDWGEVRGRLFGCSAVGMQCD